MASFATNKPKISTLKPKFCYQPYKKSYINQLVQYGFTAPMDSSKHSKKTKSHFRVWLKNIFKSNQFTSKQKHKVCTPKSIHLVITQRIIP